MTIEIRKERHFGERVIKCFAKRPANAYAAFADAARAQPNREALVFGEIKYTYRTLLAEIDRAAARMHRMGLAKGDRIILFGGNRPEFVFNCFAAFRLGIIVVPADKRLRADEIAYLAKDCGASAIFHDAELESEIPGFGKPGRPCATGFMKFAEETKASDPTSGPTIDEEDIVMLIYTSGTTGRPKGVMLTHLNLIHSCLHFHLMDSMSANDRIGVVTPVTHVTGLVMGVVGALSIGATMILVEHFKARTFLETAARERMTQTVLVPAMYNLILLEPDLSRFDLSAWRLGNYGGAPMPEATIAAVAKAFPSLQLVNGYGSSETCSPAAMLPPGEGLRRMGYVGIELPCAEIVVMDEQGCELPPGEAGEVWIAGPMVGMGYWGDPEGSRASFVGGFWRSGDIGSIDADRYLKIHDRIKDVVNRGGYKIYSAEVENVLAQVPGVVEVAVVGKPCPVLGERVHAFVSVSETVAAETLRTAATKALADYKIPETFTISGDRLPRNSAGKIMKRQLRDALIASLEAGESAADPQIRS